MAVLDEVVGVVFTEEVTVAQRRKQGCMLYASWELSVPSKRKEQGSRTFQKRRTYVRSV